MTGEEFPWEKKNRSIKHRIDPSVFEERQIPHAPEAEQGVLGCIFLSAHECLNQCIEKFKPGSEVFHDLRHQVIYDLLVEMYDKKEAIDVITVQQKLKDRKSLESVGGVVYLASLPDMVPSAANLDFYVNIVLEKFLVRKMVAYCSDFTGIIYEHRGEVDRLLEEFEAGAMSIRNSLNPVTENTILEMVKQRLTFYQECEERGGSLIGLSTGYHDLDRITDGLKDGEMIVLAARPSVGKTSLAMNIAENLAIDQSIPVGVFSLEMSKESLVGRMISSRGRVNERNITRAATTEHEKKNIFTGAIKVSKAPIFIDDTAGLTILQLKARARRMVQRHKIKLLVIDYIQLLRVSKPKGNRQEEIAEISNNIKQLAKELRIPIIAICQLNRDIERDKDRKPRVSDLRESGQIEQDADIIGLLYAADPEEAAKSPDVLRVNVLIAKNRNGPTGDVPFLFSKQFTRFDSVSKIEPQAPTKVWTQKSQPTQTTFAT